MKLWDFLPEMAICATMSAGKSTVLNALLGVNYIPSSNLACTAKVSSFLNCCELEGEFTVGAKRMRDGRIIEGVAEGDKISSWNDDDNVEQIYLVGTFPNISTPFVVHDTPGVNSALNPIHRDVTQNFLTENPPALLAFVINAENNGSNDEAHFLRWLGRNLVDKHGTEIIFVLNKMDSPDFEREDRQGFLDDTRAELIQLGFKSPKIFPVSAEAALLFRMLLNRKELNRRESLRVADYYTYFLDDGFNLVEDNPQISEDTSAGVENFSEKNFSVASLHEAIRRTGICALEDFLTEKFMQIEDAPEPAPDIVANDLKFFPHVP